MFSGHFQESASFCDYMPVHAAKDIEPGPVFLEASKPSFAGDFLRVASAANTKFVGIADAHIGMGQTSSIAVAGVVLVESQRSHMNTHDLFRIKDFWQTSKSGAVDELENIVGSVINKHDSIFTGTGEKHVYRISLMPWINHAKFKVSLSASTLDTLSEEITKLASVSTAENFPDACKEKLKEYCTTNAVPM